LSKDAATDEGTGEDAALDAKEEDVTGSGDVQPYGQCSTTEECQPGYTCETFRDNPLYGQCTKTCVFLLCLTSTG
jgi:hypothetical protein